jgi:hypothetical protein
MKRILLLEHQPYLKEKKNEKCKQKIPDI